MKKILLILLCFSLFISQAFTIQKFYNISDKQIGFSEIEGVNIKEYNFESVLINTEFDYTLNKFTDNKINSYNHIFNFPAAFLCYRLHYNSISRITDYYYLC